MFIDVEDKIKKKNKILFNEKSSCLAQLVPLLSEQSHRIQVMWAFDCLPSVLEEFEKIVPSERRPRECVLLCRRWAQGKIKMKEAKRAILACHAVAKEIDDKVGIALSHAIGQGGSTVHVGSHSLGLVVYELTAIVIHHNYANYEEEVLKKIEYYMSRLLYWKDQITEVPLNWASFL